MDDTRMKAAAARLFGDAAPQWRARGLAPEARLEPIIAGLGCGPGSLILDAGCGPGNISIPLALRGYRVRAFDLAPEMVAEARAAAAEHGLDAARFAVRPGDVEQIPFPDGTFDAALCFNVLDFAPRPGVALHEFWRVLRPGGRLVLSTLGARSPVKVNAWRRFLPGADLPPVGNHILPWETEALLQELGWHLADAWGRCGPATSGAENPDTDERLAALPDRVLQQAVASAWQIVAEKPAAPTL